MPFKPVAEPEDYPERYQARPSNGDWIEQHQEDNMNEIMSRREAEPSLSELVYQAERLICEAYDAAREPKKGFHEFCYKPKTGMLTQLRELMER